MLGARCRARARAARRCHHAVRVADGNSRNRVHHAREPVLAGERGGRRRRGRHGGADGRPLQVAAPVARELRNRIGLDHLSRRRLRHPHPEGAGVGPDVNNPDDVGVYSKTAEYVRFVGLVSRGWNEGFGNGWADGVDSTAVSNGHWEIEHCASYSNGRTGFTFFSASDFHLKNSISAHNGSNTVASWSSGVTLFEATGTNLVEGTVSFENTNGQNHTDGSGFIVDEGATTPPSSTTSPSATRALACASRGARARSSSATPAIGTRSSGPWPRAPPIPGSSTSRTAV